MLEEKSWVKTQSIDQLRKSTSKRKFKSEEGKKHFHFN